MVWFGLVWFGLVLLVWFGLVRLGLVWFGLVWFALDWRGLWLPVIKNERRLRSIIVLSNIALTLRSTSIIVYEAAKAIIYTRGDSSLFLVGY